MSNPKVYLASPFFNDRERNLVADLQQLIASLDYEVYSPSRDGILLKPNSGSEDRQRVLDENKRAIDECDIVVANTDGDSLKTILPENVLKAVFSQLQEYSKEGWITHAHFSALGKLVGRDPGTYWELGYAHAQDKLTVTYSELGFDINVMIGESVIAHTKSREELIDALTAVRPIAPSMTPSNDQVVEILANLQSKYKRDYRVF